MSQPLDAETLLHAQRVWNYHQLHHSLAPADVIFVLGSHDTRVAERGAELLLQGYAPWLLFSGGLGRLTQGAWTETEAAKFGRVAEDMGVAPEQILLEDQSTNTGENIRFSFQLLQEKGITPKRIILVQKPYMERRTFATFMKQWPGPAVDIQVTSPQISFEQYPTQEVSREEVISIMLGDLQRIKVYPELGFQIPQEIPEEVWQSFEFLKQRGFTHHLLP